MKKILSILICAVLITSFATSPLKVSANTAQNEQLISLLMQMVTMLQAQLAVLLGQDHQTDSTTSVAVVSPNGGEVLTMGQSFQVKWKTDKNKTGFVGVSLIGSNGTRCNLDDRPLGNSLDLARALSADGTCYNTGSGIPVTISPGKYKIQVSNFVDGITTTDESDNFFTIVGASSNTCKSEVDGMPVITSLSSTSGPIGTVLEINGCGLTGFEGDLNVYFEKEDGTKFLLTDTSGDFRTTGGKLIKVTVKEPCQKGETIYGAYSGIPSICSSPKMTTGVYKVYTTPWNKKSNVVTFTVTP